MAATSQSQVSDILEAALDEAFSAPQPHLIQPEVENPPSSEVPATPSHSSLAGEATDPLPSSSSSLDDSWKEEYDGQLKEWRAQHAQQREKAEKEQLKWEAIRAKDQEEAALRKAAGITPSTSTAQGESWEKVGPSGSTTVASSQVLDPEQSQPPSIPESQGNIHSRQETTTDELQKWEDVPSVTSSFPSLSFDTPPPPPPPPAADESAPPPPVSVTLAIFDNSLSTRTRVLALVSSLAVNLILPFVNGVMLGFGEIFAKDVVMGWLGWKGPASTVTNVGIKSRSSRSIFR